MAPPRTVHNLHCKGTFAEGARAVLAVRLEELEEHRERITGLDDSQALHDLRIAAKRLRYSLETFSIAFPPDTAQTYADHMRDLQDVLGRVHDLDVLAGLLAGRIRQLDEEARARGLEIARETTDEGDRQHELQQLVWGDERHARLGLYSLIGSKADERREQYQRFVALWNQWEASGVLPSLRAMTTGTSPSDQEKAGRELDARDRSGQR